MICKKGDILMKKNRYSLSLYSILLMMCLFLGIVFVFLSGCSEKSRQAKVSPESVSDKRNIAELPKIGEIVTTERALGLCVHYGLNHLAKRIEDDPDLFKKWKFDGCSMTPSALLSELIKVPTLIEICLRHDLGYAYGEPGNEEERIVVDRKFENELMDGGAGKGTAKAMFDAVRAGGKEKFCLPFSWSFARVAPCKPGFGLILKQ